jgi:hypothetical protein
LSKVALLVQGVLVPTQMYSTAEVMLSPPELTIDGPVVVFVCLSLFPLLVKVYSQELHHDWAWWCMPANPDTQEAQAGRLSTKPALVTLGRL